MMAVVAGCSSTAALESGESGSGGVAGANGGTANGGASSLPANCDATALTFVGDVASTKGTIYRTDPPSPCQETTASRVFAAVVPRAGRLRVVFTATRDGAVEAYIGCDAPAERRLFCVASSDPPQPFAVKAGDVVLVRAGVHSVDTSGNAFELKLEYEAP